MAPFNGAELEGAELAPAEAPDAAAEAGGPAAADCAALAPAAGVPAGGAADEVLSAEFEWTEEQAARPNIVAAPTVPVRKLRRFNSIGSPDRVTNRGPMCD